MHTNYRITVLILAYLLTRTPLSAAVIEREHPERVPPAIHANYYITFDLKAGDEVTFKVRSFAIKLGEEI
jgi:hypothetical protein